MRFWNWLKSLFARKPVPTYHVIYPSEPVDSNHKEETYDELALPED